jgi:NitT/TauT family transport system substrate-binding protein
MTLLRSLLIAAVAAMATSALPQAGFAADKIVFLTSWYAQAEHAGSTRPRRPGFTRRPAST